MVWLDVGNYLESSILGTALGAQISSSGFRKLLQTLWYSAYPSSSDFIRLDYVMSCVFGNTLWLIAIGYYLYISFLGYSGQYSQEKKIKMGRGRAMRACFTGNMGLAFPSKV